MAMFGPKHGLQFSLPSPTNLVSVNKQYRFPLKPFPSKHTKHVRMEATTNLTCNDQESNRKFKKLPPSQWGDHFLSAQVDVSEMDSLAREMEILKTKVGDMFVNSSKDVESIKKRILFIYLLVSLGVAYHFEDQIEESLKEGFGYIEEMTSGEDDLYTISIFFWIFRRYGYNMSSEVFKRFTNENGKFKESLIGDAKGMVSLYEAAHLRTTMDNIMEEALTFTTCNLELLEVAGACPPHILKRIGDALRMPQHFNTEAIFAKEYISFYEQEEAHNKMLLRFSKINFKFMQLTWIQELKMFTKWWKGHDLASRLPPYFRDRLLENYVFGVMIYFEPQMSLGRIAVAKLSKLFSILDDTCDRYGSISEVTALVHCLERWVPDCMDNQPDYMKTVFKFALNTFEECENAGKAEQGLSFSVEGAIEEFKIYSRANLQFTEWAHSGVVPTFDEYLEIGGTEVSMYISIAGTYLGLGKIARDKAYEWLKSRPKFVQAQAKKGRLMNDMAGFEDDMSRGYVVNAITCYMKQYQCTEEEAFGDLQNMVNDLDKTVNEELLKKTETVSREILKPTVDFGKIVDCTYRNAEEYTNPEGRFKQHINSLFVDVIRL